ncbi:MAG TPA: hypothetical protein ENN57_00745 [Chloroflexi bacterium]|nr:hypothetical protein [Chloroflexota bacterium]
MDKDEERRKRGFMRGIWTSIPYFLNWYGEWHALIEGFCDGFCWFVKRKYKPDDDLKEDIQSEHHYYNIGLVLGLASFVALIGAIVVWIRG